MNQDFILKKLATIVGSENVTNDENILEVYSKEVVEPNDGIDPRAPSHRPDFVVNASNIDEIQRIVSLANRYKLPVVPIGSYISSYGLSVPLQGGILLDTRKMNQYEIDEDALTISIEPGVTLGQLIRELSPNGYMIHYPQVPPANSIFGCYLTNGTGGLRGRYGYLCEDILGLEVILPTGKKVTTGSGAFPGAAKFNRYVYGPDLTGLFLNAQGTLGIVTKLTIKLRSIPRFSDVVATGVNSLEQTVKLMYELGRLEAGDYLGAFSRMHVNLLAHVEPSVVELLPEWMLVVHVVGNDEDVVEAEKRMVEKIVTKVGTPLEPTVAGQLHFMQKPELLRPYIWMPIWWAHVGGGRIVHNLNMPLIQIPEFNGLLHALFSKYNLVYGPAITPHKRVRAHLVVPICYSPADSKETDNAMKLNSEVIKLALDRKVIFYRPNKQVAPQLMPRLGGYYELLKTIKKTLDPNNIMSPGRLCL